MSGKDLPGDPFLATHGIDAYQPPIDIQRIQQFGNRRDFVALLGNLFLAKHQTQLCRVSVLKDYSVKADTVQCYV